MQLFFSFTEKSARDLLPLAHEYQVRKLNRIEHFLIYLVRKQHDAIPIKDATVNFGSSLCLTLVSLTLILAAPCV
jgi:hypothetical protein